MSESELLPNPRPDLHDPATNPVEPESPDPLLESGSFIDPNRTEPRVESSECQKGESTPTPNVAFAPGTVIAAQPISMVAPGEFWDGASRTQVKRNPEERPSWLPEDWRMEVKIRSSGSSAGTTDRYYFEPLGQRRFRSKSEVFHFLETGTKRKKKSRFEADAGRTGSEKEKKSPGSEKQKKSSVKRKKAEA